MCPKDIGSYKIKSALIIGTSCLGDNIILSPAIKKIRDAFKDAEIDIVIGERAIEFAIDNSWFSNYFVYKKGRRLKRVVNLIKLINKLNKKRYDLIVDFRNSFIPFFIRGRFRLTFFFKEFFSEKIYTHETERVLKFLEPYFGKEEDISLYFPVTKKDRDDVELFLRNSGVKPSEKIVVFNPGGRANKKRWSEEKFAEVGKVLLNNYDSMKIIIVGSIADEYIAARVKEMIRSDNVFNLAGKTTLKQLAALLERASLIITNDTGTLHLASAMHCPTVAIFGPTNPYRYGPIGTKNIVIHSDIPCFPCNEKKRCKKNYICIDKITPAEVIKAAMLFLDEKEQPLLFDL